MSTKAALVNVGERLTALEERQTAGERHLATLVGDVEKLRESNHNIANGLTRVEGILVELRDNDTADAKAIGQLQNVVGAMSDRMAEMIGRFDRFLGAASIHPEPPSSVGFAAPEERTNPGVRRHGDR